MSSADLARAGSETEPVLNFGYWPGVRRAALALYFVGFLVWSYNYGIPVQRVLVIAWVCGALACACLGRHPREMLQLIIDWAPMVIVLGAYDITRGAADKLGIGVHFHTMIDFDKAVFFGQTPTEWLQHHLYNPNEVSGWNVAFTLIYTSYFLTPFALAGWLWARDRAAYLRFAKRLVSLAIAGVTTYILFPAAPPWMAADEGLLHDVARTTGQGWKIIGVGTSVLFSEGQRSVNLVAAVPSLHSAFTMLVALFLWDRVRWRRARPLLLLYPAAMGLTLMATGEHYFFDVLLGWLYAGGVMVAWSAWERARATRSSRVEAADGAQAAEIA
ncbi:MAG TPA: phosphatase PAP2 family protein [Solirubrobacterales bacterium]|nr:phosphatase PAP2 family protein [Solirubrobacterales bacterium]